MLTTVVTVMLVFTPSKNIMLGECQLLVSWAVPVQLDWLNSALSPVVYGDIALSINTQYNTIMLMFYDHSLVFCRRQNAIWGLPIIK